MKKGKLIVIDGTDGSGKATQVDLLVKHLKKEGRKVKIVDFPEYYDNFFGGFIAHCLREQYFNFLKVHPKIASVLYAADRFESKDKMEKWLKEGAIIVANRYVSANQIHQGGKVREDKKRKAFLAWLDEMEYKVFKLPKPDVVFYLDVPISTTKKLIKKREQNGIKRAYLKKKNDLAEYDMEYLENSRKSAVWLAKTQKEWSRIECLNAKGELLPPNDVHEKIWSIAKKFI